MCDRWMNWLVLEGIGRWCRGGSVGKGNSNEIGYRAGRGTSPSFLTFTHVRSCVRVASSFVSRSSISYSFILVCSTSLDLTQCITLSVQNNLLQEELVFTVSLRPHRSSI
jgi:hypothetical protein